MPSLSWIGKGIGGQRIMSAKKSALKSMQKQRLDTKSVIFNKALRLFAENGVENVSMRDIANAVGIKTGSMYNHYKSKQEIVDACYEFYYANNARATMKKKDMLRILKEGSKEDIINAVRYRFPEEIGANLTYAMMVTLQRVYIDENAKEAYEKTYERAMKHISEFFREGINIGRFEEFDVMAIANILISTRIFTGMSIAIRPEYLYEVGKPEHWANEQKKMLSALLAMLPFRDSQK